MSFRFRPQRRTLDEAMAEERVFENRAALQAHLTAKGEGQILSIEKYGSRLDTRIDPPYDTHIVMVDSVWGQMYEGGVPAGFTDRAVP